MNIMVYTLRVLILVLHRHRRKGRPADLESGAFDIINKLLQRNYFTCRESTCCIDVKLYDREVICM